MFRGRATKAGGVLTHQSKLSPQEQARVLLSSDSSRCNKMHLAAAWGYTWRWAGDGPTRSGVMRSRMEFWIDGAWRQAKSWDEDVRPFLEES